MRALTPSVRSFQIVKRASRQNTARIRQNRCYDNRPLPKSNGPMYMRLGVSRCPAASWHEGLDSQMNAGRKLEQLAQRFEPGSRLIRYWPLKGGISSLMFGFELAR